MIMNATQQREKFWPLVCTLYEQDGVESVCLDLQDSYGCNVNLLLILVTLEALGMVPTEDSMSALADLAAEWEDEILGPVRRSRRDLKSASSGALLDIVKDMEIIIERAEHDNLFENIELVAAGRKNPSRLEPYIRSKAGDFTRLPDLTPLSEAASVVSFA